MNFSAYGERNGRRVVLGTGETVLGPRAAVGGRGACVPITRVGKWPAAETVSEGAVVPVIRRTAEPSGREGPLLHRCRCEQGGALVSARVGLVPPATPVRRVSA